MVPIFKSVGERYTAKNYHPVSQVSVVSEVFEKLVNNRIVDHLVKCDLSSDFQFGFRPSRSTAYLLIVVSNRIARAFNRSGASRAIELDMPKVFGRVWHASHVFFTLMNCDLSSDFQFGFRPSRSTADLLIVVSNRIARPFNRSGASRALELDMPKAFGRVWHASHVFFKLKP